MFTVRHIQPSGHDALFESRSVQGEPVEPDSENVRCVYLDFGDGERACISTGTVYVMNAAGKTVAKYYLGGWAEPQDEGVTIGEGAPIGTGGTA